MKILLMGICLFFSSNLFASESYLIDGKVVFAVARVGNAKGSAIAWTQEEKDKMIANFETFKATSPYTVEDLTPTKFETRVSTTFAFVNYSAWKETLEMTNEELDDAKKELDRENKIKNFKKNKK